MDKQNELVDEIKSELETIEASFWELSKLVNNLLDQKKSFKERVPQYQIKHFRCEDFN